MVRQVATGALPRAYFLPEESLESEGHRSAGKRQYPLQSRPGSDSRDVPLAESYRRWAVRATGVLIDRGNGNFGAPEPKLVSKDRKYFLMLLPDVRSSAQWNGKLGENPAAAECTGYARPADDFIKDIRLHGQEIQDLPSHNISVLAVHEIKQMIRGHPARSGAPGMYSAVGAPAFMRHGRFSAPQEV